MLLLTTDISVLKMVQCHLYFFYSRQPTQYQNHIWIPRHFLVKQNIKTLQNDGTTSLSFPMNSTERSVNRLVCYTGNLCSIFKTCAGQNGTGIGLSKSKLVLSVYGHSADTPYLL